jgi:hypothetical protein
MSPEATGTGTGMITELPQAPATAYDGLVRQVGEVRDEVRITGQDADGLHEQIQGRALDSRTAAVAQRESADLLDDLSTEWGLSWTLTAKLLKVSQTSVRKWRRNESLTPENRRGVARLVAFLEMLRSDYPAICDQASWLEIRISEESTLTPADLYEMGRCELLFDLAGLCCAPHEVLYAVDPQWRDRYGVDSRFAVVKGPDGLPSIVARDHG